MLRTIRILFAAVFFTCITLLFLDFTGTLHAWFSWMAEVQMLPAVMASHFVIVATLVVVTLLFGRIYCSVVCPLGVFQDVVDWLSRRRKKHRHSYSPAKTPLRIAIVALLAVAFVANMAFGFGSLVALLDPYSLYGRMAASLFQPVYIAANNILASLAERADSYAFYSREVWLRSGLVLGLAALTFVVIAVLAWRGGRTYCNTFCPVGTLLGVLSRFSLLKISINPDRCVKCGRCAKECKASCIDYKHYTIDHSRCVVCGNCIGKCHKHAIGYARPQSPLPAAPEAAKGKARDKADEGRRAFLLGSLTAATTAAVAQQKMKVDGGYATIVEKIAPERHTPITPPGSLSAQNMASSCTACQLCVAECPNDVLRPSASLATLMQPTMSFERGYCRPECVRCSEVCPAGAIKPITRADKSAIHIGHAVWIRKNCVPVTDGQPCGNCARHCPTGAIFMVPLEGKETNDKGKKLSIPVVNEEKCIGCGACENLCPAAPFAAIYVEGHEVHRVN